MQQVPFAGENQKCALPAIDNIAASPSINRHRARLRQVVVADDITGNACVIEDNQSTLTGITHIH